MKLPDIRMGHSERILNYTCVTIDDFHENARINCGIDFFLEVAKADVLR